MNQVNELNDFLNIYEEYVEQVLIPTKNEIDEILSGWKKTFWSKATNENHESTSAMVSPSPINWVKTRIKRPEAVVDKILSQKSTFPLGLKYKSLRIMNDTVAGSIIVHFLSDLSLVHNAIMNSELFHVSDKSPPAVFLEDKFITQLGLQNLEKRKKDTGYSAIHYIVRLKDSSVEQENRPYFEIQVKTLAQHAWGEIEHILGYKPNNTPTLATRKQLKLLAPI